MIYTDGEQNLIDFELSISICIAQLAILIADYDLCCGGNPYK